MAPDSNALARARGVAHFVGSIPLPDAEAVFRTVSRAAGPWLARLPDGETGIRQGWIRFLQDVLAAHPAIEVAADLPAFRFVQWDGTLVREIPRLRMADRDALAPEGFRTGYAEMAVASWRVFESLQEASVIPAGVRFQISLPTPTAPVYNNMLPGDRPAVLEALTRHMIGEVEAIAAALPHERVALQWDVCQEVLAWEGYYAPGPVDFRTETLGVLTRIGDAVPRGIELGFHLCYGSPADEHIVQPADTRIMVEIVNAIAARIGRPIDYVHVPVPRTRADDAYFAPLASLALDARTSVYLGLVHHDDAAGDAARLEAARRFTRVDGVAAECGMGRGDPSRLEGMLAAHVAAAERVSELAPRDVAPARTETSASVSRDGPAHEHGDAPAPVQFGPEPEPEPEPESESELESELEEDEVFSAEPERKRADSLSPSVRRLVKQYGLDVSGLRGTGPGGRLRMGDVMALIGSRDAPADDAAAGSRNEARERVERPSARAPRSEPTARPRPAQPEFAPEPEPEAPPAAAPVAAATGASPPGAEPATTTVFECDAGAVLEHQRHEREQGREIALSAYFVASFAHALRDTNALSAESGHRIPRLGVEARDGTHVLTDAEQLTVGQISVALNAPVVASAAPIVLIRHHGPAGSLLVQSDRLAPEHVAVLGIGRITRQVVVRVVRGEEAPRIASRCLLSLTFRTQDTRLGDANDLLARCVARIERWPV